MSTVNPLDQLRRRIGSGSAPVAFAALAEEHRRAGRLAEAVAVCRDGLERYPTYVSARVTLGRALLDLGHVREAVAELEAAVEQAPDNLAAGRVLGEARERLAALPPGDDRPVAVGPADAEPVAPADSTDAGRYDAPGVGDSDHAGVWPMPFADHATPGPASDVWLQPAAPPAVAHSVASSWDDETIYAPVVPASTEPTQDDVPGGDVSQDARPVGATHAATDEDDTASLVVAAHEWGAVEAAAPDTDAQVGGPAAPSSWGDPLGVDGAETASGWADVEEGHEQSWVPSDWFAAEPDVSATPPEAGAVPVAPGDVEQAAADQAADTAEEATGRDDTDTAATEALADEASMPEVIVAADTTADAHREDAAGSNALETGAAIEAKGMDGDDRAERADGDSSTEVVPARERAGAVAAADDSVVLTARSEMGVDLDGPDAAVADVVDDTVDGGPETADVAASGNASMLDDLSHVGVEDGLTSDAHHGAVADAGRDAREHVGQTGGTGGAESSGDEPAEAVSPWATLLEAAVDEVFADAATGHDRVRRVATAREWVPPAEPASSEYDDETLVTLQKLLAAVRARRAELGLMT